VCAKYRENKIKTKQKTLLNANPLFSLKTSVGHHAILEGKRVTDRSSRMLP